MKSLRNNQSGLVSITVTMIFISIITIVTLSFAFLMRRESEQVLDRQLSTQAFYAAESGVSDTIGRLANVAGVPDADTECLEATDPAALLDSTSGIRYSCLLYNKSLNDLKYTIGSDAYKIVPLKSSQNIHRINISWQNADTSGTPTFSSQGNFWLPQWDGAQYTDSFAEDSGTAILRTSIIPVSSGLSVGAQFSPTIFLYPKEGDAADTDSFTYTNSIYAQGEFVEGNCSTARSPYCSVDIFMAGAASREIALRIKSIYSSSSVVVTAYGDSGQQLPLVDAQVEIDATGRANEVLRRIQVRVPLKESFLVPDFAVESADSLCKRLVTRPGSTTYNLPLTELNGRDLDADALEEACKIPAN